MRNPIITIILSYVIGYLVTNGYVEQANASQLSDILDQVAGLFILLATTIYSLHKFVHLHPVPGQVVKNAKAEVKIESSTTDTPSVEQDPGVPPVGS